MRRLVAFCLTLLLGTPANAYVVSGYFWETGSGTFHVNIAGTAPSGVTWNSAFLQAMEAWTAVANFQYVLETDFIDPCLGQENGGFGNGVTSVGFSADVCGSAFGANTLAITLTSGNCIADCSGDYRVSITDADILFKTGENWDVYSGDRRAGRNDFRRVALHELGHALGLRHSSDPPAIMEGFISSVESLRDDDIAGVTAIYGESAATITNRDSIYGVNIMVPTGSRLEGPDDNFSLSGKLSDTDARFGNIPIDIYEYTFANDSSVSIALNSDNFDGLLYLARVTAAQEMVTAQSLSDDNSGPGTNAEIVTTLQAGTYWVGVTAAGPAAAGVYDLSIRSSSNSPTTSFQSYQSAYGIGVEINANPTIDGALQTSDFMLDGKYIDLYEFELAASARLRIDLSSAGFENALYLARVITRANPADALIADDSLLHNSGFNGSSNSRIEQTLLPGTYWIGVTSTRDAVIGTYRIDTTLILP